MPSKFGTSGIGAIYNGVDNIVAVYKGTELCFSSGDASIPLIVPFIERTISSVEGFLSNQMTQIGDYSFYNCSNLREITIPNSVTSFGTASFEYCSSLEKINLPTNLVEMGNYCLAYCTSLPSLVIPDGVTILNQGLFHSSNIKSVTLPSTLETIGINAFALTTVEELIILATTPPTWSSTTDYIPTVTSGKIYIPKGTLEAYQTAEMWSKYTTGTTQYVEM